MDHSSLFLYVEKSELFYGNWLTKSSKFQVYNLTVRHIYIYCIVCSPPIVRFLSVITYLTPFTAIYLLPPCSPLVITSLLSRSLSLCLFVLFICAFRFKNAFLSVPLEFLLEQPAMFEQGCARSAGLICTPLILGLK